MSLMTQGYLLDKYGPRLGTEHLAEVLGIAKQTLYKQITENTCQVRTYLDGGKRFADYRDVDAYLDRCREAVADVA